MPSLQHQHVFRSAQNTPLCDLCGDRARSHRQVKPRGARKPPSPTAAARRSARERAEYAALLASLPARS